MDGAESEISLRLSAT